MTIPAELLAGWQDGSLTAAERQELLQILQSDPAAAKRFVQDQRLHIGLQALLLRRPVDDLTARVEAVLAGSSVWRQRARRRGIRRRLLLARWRPWLLAAAGLLLAALGSLVLWSGQEATSDRPRLISGVASSGTGSLAPGARLAEGAQLRLAANERCSLGWDDGTRLDCLGPATLAFDLAEHPFMLAAGSTTAASGKQCLLQDGRIVAQVSRQAPEAPFRLGTPHGLATVRGTRFTVTVAAEGSRLQIASGLVQWTSADGDELLGPAASAVALDQEVIEAARQGLWRAGPLLAGAPTEPGSDERFRLVGDEQWDWQTASWIPHDESRDDRRAQVLQLAAGDNRLLFPLPDDADCLTVQTTWILLRSRHAQIHSDLRFIENHAEWPWPEPRPDRPGSSHGREMTLTLLRRQRGGLGDWYELLYDAGGRTAWHGLAFGEAEALRLTFDAVPAGNQTRAAFQALRLRCYQWRTGRREEAP